jgi:hypothetical protein
MNHSALLPPLARTIKWDTIPINDSSSWIEKSNNPKFLSNLFLACALPPGTATYYVAFKSVAKPINIILVSCGSAITSVMLVAGVVLRCLASRDPKWVQRQKLSEKCKDRIPSLQELIKYDENVLSRDEIQVLLEQDIRNLSYQDFVEKHDIFLLDQFDDTNIPLLKPKYLRWLYSHLANRKIEKIAADRASQLLGVSEDEIADCIEMNRQGNKLASSEKKKWKDEEALFYKAEK